MVVKNITSSDLSELDTKQRIMEVAMNLFARKGFDGATIREIAKLAEVNVASLNYHFKSKENLRLELLNHIVQEFKNRISNTDGVKTAAEYAVKVYKAMSDDSAQCLNQFKLILEAEVHPCETDPYPKGYEQFSIFLAKELNPSVPEEKRMWLVNVVFSYVIHISVMSSTTVGKLSIERFFPKKKASIPDYITELVETMIRDLNQRYR